MYQKLLDQITLFVDDAAIAEVTMGTYKTVKSFVEEYSTEFEKEIAGINQFKEYLDSGSWLVFAGGDVLIRRVFTKYLRYIHSNTLYTRVDSVVLNVYREEITREQALATILVGYFDGMRLGDMGEIAENYC